MEAASCDTTGVIFFGYLGGSGNSPVRSICPPSPPHLFLSVVLFPCLHPSCPASPFPRGNSLPRPPHVPLFSPTEQARPALSRRYCVPAVPGTKPAAPGLQPPRPDREDTRLLHGSLFSPKEGTHSLLLFGNCTQPSLGTVWFMMDSRGCCGNAVTVLCFVLCLSFSLPAFFFLIPL